MVQTFVAVRIGEFLFLRCIPGNGGGLWDSRFHSTLCPLFILPEIGLCIFHYSSPDTPESVAFIRFQSNSMNFNEMRGGERERENFL